MYHRSWYHEKPFVAGNWAGLPAPFPAIGHRLSCLESLYHLPQIPALACLGSQCDCERAAPRPYGHECPLCPNAINAALPECQNARKTRVTDCQHYAICWDMNILAIANQKGGTAKTTTAAALGVLLSRAGTRTHLIDMDPQASLTTAFGQRDPKGLLYRALWQRESLPVVAVAENLTLSPSSIDLSRGETQFIAEPAREYLLQACLERTAIPADATVILDCPPSLGILSIACLTAAQWLCVVVQPGGFELRTLVHLDETVQILRERVNARLQVLGAILTNCHPRRAITEDVRDEVSRRWPVLGQVRADARLLYATTSGKVYYLTRSKAMEDYAEVVAQLRRVAPWAELRLPVSAASSGS